MSHSASINVFTSKLVLDLPRDLVRIACSLVCPPLSNPASKPPLDASTTKTPTSALAAPVIMFGMKSRCPGASSKFIVFELVSNIRCATSTVIPRDLKQIRADRDERFRDRTLFKSKHSFKRSYDFFSSKNLRQMIY